MIRIDYNEEIKGTPFRGLIVFVNFGYCAYLGVPENHGIANIDGLEFHCHRGVTFSGPGGDGIRPPGFWWYGWDYMHYGDALQPPPGLLETLPNGARSMLLRGKKWSVEEIEHDLIDSAIDLLARIEAAQKATAQALTQTATIKPV